MDAIYNFVDLCRNNPRAVKKFWAAVATAIAVAASEGLLDQSLVTVALAVFGSLGVYATTNDG